MSEFEALLNDLDPVMRKQFDMISRGPVSMIGTFQSRFLPIAEACMHEAAARIAPGLQVPDSSADLVEQLKNLLAVYAAKATRSVSLKLGRQWDRYWAGADASDEQIDRLLEARDECDGDWPGVGFKPKKKPTLPTRFYLSVVEPKGSATSAQKWWNQLVGDTVTGSGITIDDVFAQAFFLGAVARFKPRKLRFIECPFDPTSSYAPWTASSDLEQEQRR